MKKMAFDERVLNLLQKRLNYTDEQLQQFAENPRNEDVIAKATEINNTILVLTVVESHGCNSQHRIGDKIYMDGAGNILSKYCPARICSYALNNALMMVFAANEFIYAGISPMNIKFRRCSCFDSGIACGGLGQIVLELSVISKEELESRFKE